VAAGDGRDRTQGRERWRADSAAEDLGPEWSQRRGRGSQRCNVGRQDGVSGSGREHRHGRWSIVLGRAGAGPTQGWAGTGPSRRGPAVATQWGLAAAARRCGERRQRQNEEIFQSRMHWAAHGESSNYAGVKTLKMSVTPVYLSVTPHIFVG
jgi:hypothetical protein